MLALFALLSLSIFLSFLLLPSLSLTRSLPLLRLFTVFASKKHPHSCHSFACFTPISLSSSPSPNFFLTFLLPSSSLSFWIFRIFDFFTTPLHICVKANVSCLLFFFVFMSRVQFLHCFFFWFRLSTTG